MKKRCSLLWFRRDLRLTDNPALTAALAAAPAVVPVYIHDPDAEAPWAPGPASRVWLHHSLAALSADLAARGSPLVIRSGNSLEVLRELLRETGADAVFWNRCYEPAAIARDRAIKAALRADGLTVASHNGLLWREPWTLKTGSEGSYRVFTPYWRKHLSELAPRMITPAPDRIPGPARPPAGLRPEALALLPQLGWDAGFRPFWQPGEAGALAQLERFVDGALDGYRRSRDRPDEDGVSRLSPHLHFGEIGPDQLLVAVRRMQAGGEVKDDDADTYVKELGWREFAHHLLVHQPHTPEEPLNPTFKDFRWRKPREYAEDLRAWQHGMTGVPIVDAGMRQLWQTGWMHNRVRMIVASLLTKNLLIPWQEGARWFWDTLVDADLASNTLGWQWSAGCGADAAPFFRIFNPVLQSERFDPDGRYIRRWVPELAALPTAQIHAPWQAKPAVLAAAKVRLGTDYPLPIIDLAASRSRALEVYDQARRG
ncbi:MAG TPA: deoxyribodipyrimidine photo-lyase [Fontimonas sp.]